MEWSLGKARERIAGSVDKIGDAADVAAAGILVALGLGLCALMLALMALSGARRRPA